jgi:hypothetical protein
VNQEVERVGHISPSKQTQGQGLREEKRWKKKKDRKKE